MSKDKTHKIEKSLPFDRYHVAPIGDITPEALKQSAKLARTKFRDDEKRFSHNTALNYIAKSLGFGGGFGGYSSEFTKNLSVFMQSHGLITRRDVLSVPSFDAVLRLSYRKIADRLFESGLPVPKRIFTGNGVDYGSLVAAATTREDMKIGMLWQHPPANTSFEDIRSAQFNTSTPPHNYTLITREGELRFGEISYFQNLIGNQLCDTESCPENNEIISKMYWQGEAIPVDESRRLVEAGKILWSVLSSSKTGWVEVIPYNERLVFLKGDNGSYEFVFKGMRDQAIKRNIYAPYLRSKDISTSDAASHFQQWLYFNYSGWLETDRHIAEQDFYKAGGAILAYPGQEAILMNRFIRTGLYTPEERKAPLRDGFKIVDGGELKLCVSELVTNRQFAGFIRFNPDYAEHKRGLPDVDPWLSIDADMDLPAAVTWYDAMAYTRWIKRTKKLPVRLLNEKEYLALGRGLGNESNTQEDVETALNEPLCSAPQDMVVNGQAPLKSTEEFDRLGLRYNQEAIRWGEAKAGLKILQSAWFGEWLQPEGAAINGLFFCSQYDVFSAAHNHISAERGRFAPTSNGKYKSMKIGFRLAYEADMDDCRFN